MGSRNGNGLPPLRVLLIEDSAEDEQLLSRELGKWFKVVLQRAETEAAMQLALDAETWDVIVCDYSLPGFSPYKALEMLKTSKKDIPFIVISGVIDDSTAITILLAGAHDFIDKAKLSRLQLVIKRELRLADERLQNRIDLETAYDRTIQAWGKALELRDHHTGGHTQRVTDLTLRLARRMDVDRERLVNIHRGALLHDIGKMGVPDLVLLKDGPLDNIEKAIMEMHPRLAYNMLSPIVFLRDAIAIPYCHHEHWDGSGYPRGLSGLDIPFEARIFSVVDVFDALTSDRPYRKSWGPDRAIEYIQEESGKLFDPNVVDKFIELIQDVSHV
jgi:cyclic di-GMP phosphodiesterase